MPLPSRPTPELVPAPLRPKVLTRVPARALVLALSLLLTAGLLATPAPPARADVPPVLSSPTTAAVAKMLQDLQNRSSTTDPRYLADDIWYDGTPECFRCTLGPSVLAAQHANNQGVLDQSALAVTEATFDRAIRDHQRADGAFFPGAPGEGGPDIQTVLFANELAEAYLLIGLRLDFTHRARWSASLTRSADWLIRNNNLTYYTNGNINLALTMNMDLTYRITGLTRFKDAAARSLAFTLAPPAKFAGYGLRYTKVPTAADGSDGSGYLAESGDDPGYDPAYTIVQANLASFWYVITGSQDALRLTNLFYNQQLPRVRKSDWTIDVSGGTRRNAPGLRYRFSTPALPILALRGGRIDLQPDVMPQLQFTLLDYQRGTTLKQSSISFGYGSELAPAYKVITETPGW